MITALDNKKVKLAASLKNQKGRLSSGLFLLEGKKLIEEAVKSHYEIESIYITEGLEEKYADFLDRAEIVSASVQSKICDSETPQGISAVAKTKELPLQETNRILVAENLQDPGNMGTLLRTAESFGFDGVVTVGSAISRYSPKVMRSAMGSALRIPMCHFDTPADAFAFFKEKGISVYSAVLNDRSCKLDEICFTMPCAIAVGNEGNGLTDAFVSLSNASVYIPMSGKTESLNAGAAASVLMWEVFRQTR